MNRTTVVQQAKIASLLPPAQGKLQRNCACGNHTVAGGECSGCGKEKDKFQRKANNQSTLTNGRSLSLTPFIQRKLTIGASNDPLEQEADRIADQVLAAPVRTAVRAAPPKIQRHTVPAAAEEGTAPASVDRVLASLGMPLEPELRQDMEQRFEHDFSRVRVHSGADAEQSARDVSANAYTVGHDIVFGAGRFAPSTHWGRRLIAHELTHVIQQNWQTSRPTALALGDPRGDLEGQANDAGAQATIAKSVDASPDATARIQRDFVTPVPNTPPPSQPDLTADQIRVAISFNTQSFDQANIRLIQRLLGEPVTGALTAHNINAIAVTQGEYGLKKDGKVGPDTFRLIVGEQSLEGLPTTNDNCLTAFRVEEFPVQSGATPGPGGTTTIRGHHVIEARFSSRCNCSEFQYRQFIAGVATGTLGTVSQNVANFFGHLPSGAGLPIAFQEDGNTTCPSQNYGHRNQPGQPVTTAACGRDEYVNDAGALNQPNGCIYRAEDFPTITVNGLSTGIVVNLRIQFRGQIERNGTPVQTKEWTGINTSITTP
jgi:hypothetical protein